MAKGPGKAFWKKYLRQIPAHLWKYTRKVWDSEKGSVISGRKNKSIFKGMEEYQLVDTGIYS